VASPTTSDLKTVRALGPTEAWVGGADGTMLRWNGSTWSSTKVGAQTWRSVSGVSGDLWAVGSGGSTAHFDGVSWSTIDSGVTASLLGVWRQSASDVWAVGSANTVIRWNGSAWSSYPQPDAGQYARLAGVWASGANEVYVAGGGAEESLGGFPFTIQRAITRRWSGAQWTELGEDAGVPAQTDFFPFPLYLSNLSVIDSTEVWAKVEGGLTTPRLMRWNGSAWKPEPSAMIFSSMSAAPAAISISSDSFYRKKR